MTSAKPGFRQKALPSKKQQANDVATNLRNLQMAVRIMQMSVQQLATSYQGVSNDVSRLMGVVNNLQYKAQAAQQLSGVDDAELTRVADGLKLTDYNTASDKEDAEKGLTPLDTVAADSICIITSVCDEANKDKGIFRSKFNLAECGVPELQEKLLGCQVGARVECTLNGVPHFVELLGIRLAPPKEEAAANTATGTTAETADASATAH